MKKIFLLIISIHLISCSDNTETIKFTKNDFKGRWPFSVNEVEVYCSGYKEIYCRASNGKTYALNGSAKGVSKDDATISKIDEIWLDDPDLAGLKIPYSDFIKEGLKICENK